MKNKYDIIIMCGGICIAFRKTRKAAFCYSNNSGFRVTKTI